MSGRPAARGRLVVVLLTACAIGAVASAIWPPPAHARRLAYQQASGSSPTTINVIDLDSNAIVDRIQGVAGAIDPRGERLYGGAGEQVLVADLRSKGVVASISIPAPGRLLID